MNNIRYAYNPKYIKIRQIVKEKNVVGYIALILKGYGYIVQVNYYNTPGYVIDDTFQDIDKAQRYFNKVYHEEINK